MYKSRAQDRGLGWRDKLGCGQHVVGMRLYEVTKGRNTATEKRAKDRSLHIFNLSAMPFPKCFLTDCFFYPGNSHFEL